MYIKGNVNEVSKFFKNTAEHVLGKPFPKTIDIKNFVNPVVPCSKLLGGFKVDSAFYPSEVDQMSTRSS